MKQYNLVIVVSFFFECKAQNVKQPNIVFFLVDDLGWTDVSSFGSDFYQTPNIDKLAKKGVKFTNAYSACTVCSPSRAALMSGKYPARINCTDWITGWKYPKAKLKVPEWTMYMDTSEYTLAEAFKDAGYITGHFGKWHLGEPPEYWPKNHGFDINKGGWKSGGPNYNKARGYKGYFPPFGNPRLKDLPSDRYLTERLTDEACLFIEENQDKPFFLNFWFYNVHTRLMATPEKVQKYTALVDTANHHHNPTYAAMVEHVDEAVGKVVAKLEQFNLQKNTIIVFTSDNGGLLHNNGMVTSNYPLREGKGHVYEGAVRVPAILVAPDVARAGLVSDVPIISMDFYPTLTDLAGIKIPKKIKENWDGVSLTRTLKGTNGLERNTLFWHYPHYHIEGARPYSSVRKGDFTLLRLFEDDTYELYNLKQDISQNNNLAKENPEKLNELKNDLFDWYKEVNAQMPKNNPDFNPEAKHKPVTKW